MMFNLRKNHALRQNELLIGKGEIIEKDNAAVLHAFMPINLLGNIVIFISLGVYITIFMQGKTI